MTINYKPACRTGRLKITDYGLEVDRDGECSTFNIQHSTFKAWIFLFVVFFVSTANAQQIKVVGHFSTDSVKLGKPIEFHLSARYPQKLNLLFPDSTFSFAPFELQKKKYVPTKTENGISRDSVTYVLSSFEIDPIQTLKLPVFVLNASDCTLVFSNTDSVFFQNLVKAIPDSIAAQQLPLLTNTNYLGVRWQLNYILWGIVVFLLVVAGILVWVFFGKKIKKYFLLKRLTKGYESFRVNFESSLGSLENEFSPQNAERTLVIWKKYLESLLAKPYTKYTSKEIRALENNEALGLSLSTIDRMIYGNVEQNIRTPFTNLKEHVQQQFEKKKAEVANG